MNYKFWFFFLVAFLILENAALAYTLKLGVESIQKEDLCAVNVCPYDEYDAYSFDSQSDLCSCVNENKVVKTEYINLDTTRLRR